MNILVLSDLHLEWCKLSMVHQDRRIDDGADVVVLAGDIWEGVNGIRWAREMFVTKEVVYVTGNHEYYESNIEAMTEQQRAMARRMDVHFLQRDAVTIQGVRFLGTTLWTDFEIFGSDQRETLMREAGMGMNDFWEIRTSVGVERGVDAGIAQRRFSPVDALREHRLSTTWLAAELATGDPQRTVIVTHHAPHWESVELKYAADPLTGAYTSDLTRLMGRSRYWIHGHMHSASRYLVNGTEVVSNPRGQVYRDGSTENEAFNPAFVLEI